jgi:hypothetical protein
MKLYWSINSIPELTDLPNEKRKEVWAVCQSRCFRNWQTGISIVLMGVCIAAGIKLGKFYYGHIGGIIGAVIAGGIGGSIIWEIKVNIVRPHIREYLSSHEKTN